MATQGGQQVAPEFHRHHNVPVDGQTAVDGRLRRHTRAQCLVRALLAIDRRLHHRVGNASDSGAQRSNFISLCAL